MTRESLARARERAREDVERFAFGAPDGAPRARHFAIGDPQAPFDKVLAVLDRHGALGDDGRLARDVRLISVGDHFDWGGIDAREQAKREGLELLAWLAAHPSDQTVLIFGNHDMERLGELAGFSDEQFHTARAEADLAYRRGETDRELERAFLAKWPTVASAESVARDYSTFSALQRTWVHALLRAKRAVLAHAEGPDLLFLHAGITTPYLTALGLSAHERDARVIATAIADFLSPRFDAWAPPAPLDLSPLHRPGSAHLGEGRGFLHHRPSHPACSAEDLFLGPPQRRFDPRELPRDLTQVVGHIRDSKARALLGPWVTDAPLATGPLRSLVTDGTETRYGNALEARPPGFSQLVFIDGALSHADVSAYALFDVATRDAVALARTVG